MKFFIILCLGIAQAIAQSSPYCKCTFDWHPHILCHQREYGSCPSDFIKLNMSEFAQTILTAHNTRRNLMAGGGLSRYGFGTASRMAYMKWNTELAGLAELHVETCKDEHDCHDTERFPYSGQNLGWQQIMGDETSKQIIEDIIDGWWSEHTGSSINSDNVASGGNHFQAMALEQNSHIGCAAGIYTYAPNKQKLYLTCNYARGLISDQKLYTPGQPATGCQNGRNRLRKYQNLCSRREVYDHKPW